MYFPYLRGKQNELLVIRENLGLISTNNIVPIIEPVKKNLSGLKRTLQTLKEHESHFVLIKNPELKSDATLLETDIIEDLLSDHNNYSIGYIIDGDSKLEDIRLFFNTYQNKKISLIHYDFQKGKQLKKLVDEFGCVSSHIFVENYSGKLYRKKFKNSKSKRVLLRDGFKKQRNVDYPDDEHYSDLHATFDDEEGMDGFGDYLIVGDQYSETGGPAYAVTIHLTYIDEEDDDMRIKHFISDRTDTPVDPAGKFIEALGKLIVTINDPLSMIFKSDACEEYRRLYDRQHFPGLGYVKKLSMKHHIELMADYLNG